MTNFLVVLAIALLLWAYAAILGWYRNRIRQSIREIAEAHAVTLYTKKLQKVRKDDYGNTIDADWTKEKAYFYESVILPMLVKKHSSINADSKNVPLSDPIIEQVVTEYTVNHPIQNLDISCLNPYEFEAYCAQLLNEGGWLARITQGSGDQGIDVIGEKDGIKAVFQVKMYSSPVGNKAVQEAIAGKAFASADLAYVVSNAGYTPSAKELANKTGVKLLHYSALGKLSPFDSMLKEVNSGNANKTLDVKDRIRTVHFEHEIDAKNENQTLGGARLQLINVLTSELKRRNGRQQANGQKEQLEQNKVIFEEGAVRLTQTRFYVVFRDYPIQDILSVQASKKPYGFRGLTVVLSGTSLIVGILIFTFGLLDLILAEFSYWSLILMAVGCLVCYASSRALKIREEHTLILNTHSGEVKVLRHHNGEYVQRVANALSNHLSA